MTSWFNFSSMRFLHFLDISHQILYGKETEKKYDWLHPSSRISIPFTWKLVYCSFRFGHCFSQMLGSPNLLLASKHATYSKRFRLTWISSCVRVRRSGQPRNGLEDCRWSDMCCLRGNKNWEVGFSVVHGSIFSRGLLRWSEVFHTMVLPQESGQLPVSRLGDAIRSAGMNPTASEVGNSVSFSFHLLRMDTTRSCDIFLGRKSERYFTPLKLEFVEILKGVADATGHWSGSDIGEVSAVDAGSDWSVKCLGWWVSLADSGPI